MYGNFLITYPKCSFSKDIYSWSPHNFCYEYQMREWATILLTVYAEHSTTQCRLHHIYHLNVPVVHLISILEGSWHKMKLIPTAVRPNTWLCGRSLAGTALGWSLDQRSPTGCDVSEGDREASIMKWPWPTGGCCAVRGGKGQIYKMR